MYIGVWGMFGLGVVTGAIAMLAVIVIAAVVSTKKK